MDPNKNPSVFLKRWGLSFESANIESRKIEYTKQGDIRKMFESDGPGLLEEFKELFINIDYTIYREKFTVLGQYLIDIAKRNSKYNDLEKSLDCIISIPNYDDSTYYPIVTPLPLKPTNPTKNIVSKLSKIDEIIINLSTLVDKEDLPLLDKFKELLSELTTKYQLRDFNENLLVEMFKSFISAKDDYLEYVKDKSITVTELELIQYDTVVNNYLDNIDDYISMKFEYPSGFMKLVNEFEILPNFNEKGDLTYITTPKISKYSMVEIQKIMLSPFRKDSSFDFETNIDSINIEYIVEWLRRNASDVVDKLNYVQKYNALLIDELQKKYFYDTFKILDKDEPIEDTKSPGNNAIYYIKTKTSLLNNKLVIFDQPEDDVAPEKVKTDLIKSLSQLAISNQVIIVTHNPQLVVNLDVDNVICLDDSDEVFKIYNGPLYKKRDYDILNIIADKLDGGKDALKERWRRYE